MFGFVSMKRLCFNSIFRYKRPKRTTETVGKAFCALLKHFAPNGHYFAHWCGNRQFSLSAKGAQTRGLHACVKKTSTFTNQALNGRMSNKFSSLN